MKFPQPIPADYEVAVSLETLREWTRTSEAEFSDKSLLELGLGALLAIESKSRVILQPRTYTVKMAGFDSYAIPLFPFTGIESIKYFDAANEEQTLSTDDYTVESYSEVDNTLAYVITSFPTLYDRWDAVTITMTAGYTPVTMPYNIKQAIKHLVRHWYDNPDNPKQEFPSLVDILLRGFSRDVFA